VPLRDALLHSRVVSPAYWAGDAAAGDAATGDAVAFRFVCSLQELAAAQLKRQLLVQAAIAIASEGGCAAAAALAAGIGQTDAQSSSHQQQQPQPAPGELMQQLCPRTLAVEHQAEGTASGAPVCDAAPRCQALPPKPQAQEAVSGSGGVAGAPRPPDGDACSMFDAVRSYVLCTARHTAPNCSCCVADATPSPALSCGCAALDACGRLQGEGCSPGDSEAHEAQLLRLLDDAKALRERQARGAGVGGVGGGRSGGCSAAREAEACGVCLEEQPGLLLRLHPCGHSLCGRCGVLLVRLIAGKPALCPYCRTVIAGFGVHRQADGAQGIGTPQ
jgi:hypothetical protein